MSFYVSHLLDSHFTPSSQSPSTIRRGAAAKARKSLIRKGGPEMSAVEETERTIKLIQRHRKKRHAKLKELIMQDDDERLEVTMTGNETICPVCLSTVRGDQDIIEAHVDACIANESRLLAEAEQRERQEQDRRINVETWGEVDVNGETRARLTDVQGLRGMGFHIHDRTQEDAEEYIDVDGDDEVKYGQIQFTEQDLLDATFAVGSVTARREEEGGEDVGKALRDLVAEGKVVTKGAAESKNNTRVGPDMVESIEDIHRIDHAIALARKNRDHNLLISALESKIKQLVRSGTVDILPPYISHPLNLCVLGDCARFISNIFTMQDMLRPLCRANCIYRLLAYMLQGLLVTLLRLHKTLSGLQANYQRYRSAKGIFIMHLFSLFFGIMHFHSV